MIITHNLVLSLTSIFIPLIQILGNLWVIKVESDFKRRNSKESMIFTTSTGAYDASAISFRIRSSFLLSCREIRSISLRIFIALSLSF